MAESELLARLESDQQAMEAVGTALMNRDRQGTVAAMLGWITSALSGLPALGALVREGVPRIFAHSATRAIEAELAALAAEHERRAFIDDLAAAVEPLVQQAVIQLVRVQHDVSAERRDDVVQALGGLRADLEQFRADFGQALERDPIRAANAASAPTPALAPGQVYIGTQRVSGHAVGVVARGRGDTLVRIDLQEVLDHATGIKPSGRARVFVHTQDVRGGKGVDID